MTINEQTGILAMPTSALTPPPPSGPNTVRSIPHTVKSPPPPAPKTTK